MIAREGRGRRDPALTDQLGPTIERLLPALDAFIRFEGPDPAVRRSVWRAALDEPLPERGQGPDAVLEALNEVVIPNGLRIGHPGFSGWVTTMPTTIPTAAYLAAAVAAPQRWFSSPGNFLEYLALDWLKALLGVPAGHAGVFVSGGAVANLVGMAAARQHAGERIGVDPARDGAAAIPSPVAYASSEVHHVLLRAMAILGLGRRNLRMIGLDRARRLDTAELERALDADLRAGRTPIAIIANAGDVNTGVVDPIDELAGIAHEHGIWLHVDGAYGGFGLLDARVRALYGDVGSYDSFAVDPHKWMNVPVGCGAAFVRDPDLLGRALTPEPADYVQPLAQHAEGDTTSPFDELGLGTPDHTVEFSAPSRGMTVWAVLKEIGAAGIRERIRRDLDAARRVAERVRSSDELELLAEPVLSICVFRYRPRGTDLDEAGLDSLNGAILRTVRARGRAVPSSTRVDGRFAIRPCYINARSTLDDADALVDEVIRAGRELTGG